MGSLNHSACGIRNFQIKKYNNDVRKNSMHITRCARLYLYLRNECRPPISKSCIKLNKSCSSSYFLVCILTTKSQDKQTSFINRRQTYKAQRRNRTIYFSFKYLIYTKTDSSKPTMLTTKDTVVLPGNASTAN